MCDRSAYVLSGYAGISCFRPTVPLRRRGRFLFLLLRRLTSTVWTWWSADDLTLRAIAEIDRTRIDELSETGRALWHAARLRLRHHC